MQGVKYIEPEPYAEPDIDSSDEDEEEYNEAIDDEEYAQDFENIFNAFGGNA